MHVGDRRTSERKRTCLQAFATNLEDTIELKCSIRDVTEVGCKVVSSQIQDLPDHIRLYPEGFENPLFAKVVWRDKKAAGLSFEDDSQLDAEGVGALPECSKDQPDNDVFDLVCEKKPLGYAERLKRMRTRK